MHWCTAAYQHGLSGSGINRNHLFDVILLQIDASWNGHNFAAEALLSGWRCNTNPVDGRDRNALILASALGHSDIVEYLTIYLYVH